MNDYCEVCGQDPCVCNEGFSIKDGTDEIDDLPIDDAFDEPVLSSELAEPDPLLEDLQEKKDSYYDDEEDMSLDIPYSDDE